MGDGVPCYGALEIVGLLLLLLYIIHMPQLNFCSSMQTSLPRPTIIRKRVHITTHRPMWCMYYVSLIYIFR